MKKLTTLGLAFCLTFMVARCGRDTGQNSLNVGDTATTSATVGIEAAKKQKPKPKPPKTPLWRCVAIGINFFDGLRYPGNGASLSAANNTAIKSCVGTSKWKKCFVLPGGCARLR